MKWIIVLTLGFLLVSLNYAQNGLLSTAYQPMKDKDVLIKTVKKMPEYTFIEKLANEGVQFDMKVLDSMGAYDRVNFATAYAHECVNKKLWEECVEVLDSVKKDVGLCVDPARFFFTKATAEFMLGRKAKTNEALAHLMEVPDIARRYDNLAMLMKNDMSAWNENDIGYISRRMREVTDRLVNGQGGKKTQRIQKEILVKLDELIKEKENKKSNKCKTNEEGCPDGGGKEEQQQSNEITDPASDSRLPGGVGQGQVNKKEDSKIFENWGNLPEKERVGVEQGLERRVHEKYRGYIRIYLQSISNKGK